MVESCDLVNIHKLKHGTDPPTKSSGSTQIDFISSRSLLPNLPNTAVSSILIPCSQATIDPYISTSISYAFLDIQSKVQRDLQLNDPRLVDAYQASLIQKLVNHNVRLRADDLYALDPSIWDTHHETRFNAIDHNVERVNTCAAIFFRRKAFKKHKWIVIFTQIIY
jgi:hypothetical protein